MADPERDDARLAGDGLREIRRALRARLAGDRVVRDSVDHVLGDIIDEWEAHGVMDTSSFPAYADALRKPIDALENGPISDAKAAAEQLSRAWDEIRPKLKWG